MELTFFGADKEVTGSCHCVTANGKRILIDCGLQQGADEVDNHVLPFAAAEMDVVIVTHAHIDHSGRLPLLVKNGFRGKIYGTAMTCRLLSIMLRDSAHIQEMDTINENRKAQRAGRDPEEPIYTMDDALETLQYLVPIEYGQKTQILDGADLRFVDAGHLLGSASVELWLTEGGETKKVVFSGDIGSQNQPIIRNPQYVKEADYVVMESTYGNRYHDKVDDYPVVLADIIDRTMRNGGNVVIPSFAVGRTQELLYHIREIKERYLVKSNPNFPVYVDSPLAAEATRIYSGDLTGYADRETVEVIKNGFHPIEFSNLNVTADVSESKALNEDATPKVIISSSGMCEAGRIRHHLKHNLWRPECAVIFVGYQADGTLGRMLIDGKQEVKLFGEQIAVRAQIYNLRALSAHADRNGLLEWISAYAPRPRRVFVVHGEQSSCEEFTQTLNQMGIRAWAPDFGAVYSLTEDRVVVAGTPRRERHPETKAAAKARRVSSAFARLLQAAKRLQMVVQHNEGGANKDLGKFADQINSLCDKWDR